ncbi:DUF433 domain-containing protein [Methylobacterium terricola]|uniref:DUF433 domain-containing protein n=1 Tax=Methylobacterium terricola TaxID=2583531 RepID=A0A5C4LFN5_9HYPH|nr:DUF433 domain-containing protein [Methylobacterium terricola]TNC12406.1 DUF433 domain-containing protein [Methylobacterium terricola]
MSATRPPDAQATVRSIDDVVVSNPAILAGRRVFRGTRVPVEVLFENLADGLSLDEILDTYEALVREDVLIVLAVATRAVAEPSGGRLSAGLKAPPPLRFTTPIRFA